MNYTINFYYTLLIVLPPLPHFEQTRERMPSHCLWCKKTATFKCRCCNVATYCGVKCQKKDFHTHRAEAPDGEITHLGENGGATKVAPRGGVRPSTTPRVAQGSILIDYEKEMTSLIEIRRRRVEIMSDPMVRAEFAAKHRSIETIQMETARNMADKFPAVRAVLDELFEVELVDTEETMTTYHKLERRRMEAYGKKHGILLNWLDYSNIVRLRELAAYQLTVGVGEDIHGETSLCEAALSNGERANKLLTEFLLRPTLNRFDTGLYRRFETAQMEKEKRIDPVKQYVEDFFPFHWEQVMKDVVAMVKETYEPKEYREPVGKRHPPRGNGERSEKRTRHLGKNPGQMEVEGEVESDDDDEDEGEGEEEEEEEETEEQRLAREGREDAYRKMLEQVLGEDPFPQSKKNDINRVRTADMNEKIKAIVDAYGSDLTEEEEAALLEKVMLDARIVMMTWENEALAHAELEGIVLENMKRVMAAFREKLVENISESVSDQDSWYWKQLKKLGNWVYPSKKSIAAFTMLVAAIVGTTYLMLWARQKFATTYTPDSHLNEASKLMNDVQKRANATDLAVQAQLVKQTQQKNENLFLLRKESQISHDSGFEKMARDDYIAKNTNATAFSMIEKNYEEGYAETLLRTGDEHQPFVKYYENGLKTLRDLRALDSDVSIAPETRVEAIDQVWRNWEAGKKFSEKRPEFQKVLASEIQLKSSIAHSDERLKEYYNNLVNNNELLEDGGKTLHGVGIDLKQIVKDVEKANIHLAKGLEISQKYGDNRPFARALVAYLGSKYDKFLTPAFALQDLQSLTALDKMRYATILSVSTLDVALSGIANILASDLGKGFFHGAGAIFKWFADWGNLGAIRTVLMVMSLAGDIIHGSALIPLTTTLQDMLAVFQYDYVKPIPLEDTYFLEAILRERPDLSPEKRALYVSLREKVLLGRFYSPDIYQATFLRNDELDQLDEEELEFLERVTEEIDRDVRWRSLRVVYGYFVNRFSYNPVAVALGKGVNTFQFASDTTEKTLDYLNTTLKLATVGHILASGMSVIQIIFSATNIVRYALICCQVAVGFSGEETELLALGTIVSGASVLCGLYFLVSRLYTEAVTIPEFKMSELYYNRAHMYASVILHHTWKAWVPSLAVEIVKWTPFCIVALDKGLGIACAGLNEYYPNTMLEGLILTDNAIRRWDPTSAWDPAYILEYFSQGTRAQFLSEPRAVAKLITEVETLQPTYVAFNNSLTQAMITHNATVAKVGPAFTFSVDGAAWFASVSEVATI